MEYKETINFCDGPGRDINYSITIQEVIEALFN